MTSDDLKRAAAILREDAETIRDIVTVNGEWPSNTVDQAAKVEYDNIVALASRLESVSGEIGSLRAEREAMSADIVAAAGVLMIDVPAPGTDMARVMRANVMLRAQRAAAREREERLARALTLALGALSQLSPCAHPDCKQDQEEWLAHAKEAARAALAAKEKA